MYIDESSIVYINDHPVFVVRNLFDDEERKDLVDRISKSEEHADSFKMWSRINHGMGPNGIPQNILQKLTGIAHKYKNDRLKYRDHTCFKYDKKYGGVTQLPPHTDAPTIAQFSIDYQVSSNVDWPLYVEGMKFTLKDNDALVMSGYSHVHWREQKILQDGEFVEMINLHFAEDDFSEQAASGKIKQGHMPNAMEIYGPTDYNCVSPDQRDHSRCSHD